MNGLFKLIIAYARLTRPPAPLLMGLAVFMGQVAALGGLPEPGLMLAPVAASMLMTASSFVFNDVVDYEIDVVNRPGAPLPSGRASRRGATVFSILLFTAGFAISLQTKVQSLIMLNTMYALSILYSLRLKATGLLGNIVVALCVSASFIYGSLTATGWVSPVVLKITWVSFFINLGREVVQSIQDMEGDKVKQVRSVAIAYGPETAARLGSLFTILGLTLGPVLFLNYEAGYYGLFSQTFALILIPEAGLAYSIIQLLKNPTPKNASTFLKRFNLLTIIILLILASEFARSAITG
ncbi:MAG: geranylgeranylglycerol-phosphate geranylgeranyltransferase [Thermosphaera sp.]